MPRAAHDLLEQAKRIGGDLLHVRIEVILQTTLNHQLLSLSEEKATLALSVLMTEGEDAFITFVKAPNTDAQYPKARQYLDIYSHITERDVNQAQRLSLLYTVLGLAVMHTDLVLDYLLLLQAHLDSDREKKDFVIQFNQIIEDKRRQDGGVAQTRNSIIPNRAIKFLKLAIERPNTTNVFFELHRLASSEDFQDRCQSRDRRVMRILEDGTDLLTVNQLEAILQAHHNHFGKQGTDEKIILNAIIDNPSFREAYASLYACIITTLPTKTILKESANSMHQFVINTLTEKLECKEEDKGKIFHRKMNLVMKRLKTFNALVDYYDNRSQNRLSHFSFFRRWTNATSYSRTTKLNATKKIMAVLTNPDRQKETQNAIHFSEYELNALTEGRLGKLVAKNDTLKRLVDKATRSLHDTVTEPRTQ